MNEKRGESRVSSRSKNKTEVGYRLNGIEPFLRDYYVVFLVEKRICPIHVQNVVATLHSPFQN